MARALRTLIMILVATLGLAPGLTRADSSTTLDPHQSSLFRSWVVRIATETLRRGPSPRWVHRDCASLIRFAVNETLRPHDHAWQIASGLGTTTTPLPPELTLSTDQQRLRNHWKNHEGSFGPYVSALGLIQDNTTFVSREILQAAPGDLLFFDQGSDHHLMIWIGDGVVYHRGESSPQDHGLRAVSLEKLLHWKDTRWQPRLENANFVGIYRFSFLSS